MAYKYLVDPTLEVNGVIVPIDHMDLIDDPHQLNAATELHAEGHFGLHNFIPIGRPVDAVLRVKCREVLPGGTEKEHEMVRDVVVQTASGGLVRGDFIDRRSYIHMTKKAQR